MKSILFYLISIYYYLEFVVIKLIPAKKEETILFVKIDAIGDFVIWMDVAATLKESYPLKKNAIICSTVCYELVKASSYFDEIICIDKKKWLYNIKYRLKFIHSLSTRKFEKVINPIFSRDYYYQDLLIHLLKSDEKVGYYGDYSNNFNTLKGFFKNPIKIQNLSNQQFNKANKFYNILIPADFPNKMEKIINAHFYRKLINPSFQSHVPILPFQLPEISSFSSLESKKYIVFFVGASTQRKMWPSKHYIDLISKLDAETLVFCGGKNEEYIFNNIITEDHHSSNKIINLIGKTSLIELFSIIKEAQYIITNDTSASHICVITQTPSICILGGAHFGRFQPYVLESIDPNDQLPMIANYPMDCYNCNLNCIYIQNKNKDIWPCISNITVEKVLSLIKKQLIGLY